MMKPPFGMPNFDPSQMDPKLMMELSNLIRELPPEKLNRMQTLMHNMMAGHDVSREMEEFERGLPPGFREKVAALMMGNPAAMGSMGFGGMPGGGMAAAPDTITVEAAEASSTMELHEARMTILRAVADGKMSPDDAERLLFASES